MARFASQFTPRTELGASLQNLMGAMYAKKLQGAGGETAAKRSAAQDTRDLAEAEKARNEAAQIGRIEGGVADYVPNFAKSLVPGKDVPNVMHRLETGDWMPQEDDSLAGPLRPDETLKSMRAPQGWKPDYDAQLQDAQRIAAQLFASQPAEFQHVAEAQQAPADNRWMEQKFVEAMGLPSASQQAAQPAQRPALPNMGLPSGPGMMPTQVDDGSGVITKPMGAGDRPIDASRPILNNPDGSFSTERTITIEADGKHILIPTIVNGQQLTPEAAVEAWRNGQNNEVGIYNSAPEAEAAAQQRSRQIGVARGPQTPAPPPGQLQTPDVTVSGKNLMNNEGLLNFAALIAGRKPTVANAVTAVATASRQQQESDRKAGIEKNTRKPVGTTGLLFDEADRQFYLPGQAEPATAEQVQEYLKTNRQPLVDMSGMNIGDKTRNVEQQKLAVEMQKSTMDALRVAESTQAAAELLAGYGGGWPAEAQAQLGRILPDSDWGKIASAADAAETIRNKVSPYLRAPGSGATSDLEFGAFMNAFPGLSRTPEGRKLIASIFDRVAERLAIQADIYQELTKNDQFTFTEYRKRLAQALPKNLLSAEEMAYVKGQKAAVGPVHKSSTPSGDAARLKQLEEDARKRGLVVPP